MDVAALLVRITIVLLILFTMHYYVWVRLIKGPKWSRKTQNVLRILLLFGMTLIPLCFVFGWYGTGFAARALAFVGFSWLGLLFLLIVSTLSSELIRAGGVLMNPERRQFLSKGLSLSIGALGFTSGGIAMRGALRPIEVKTTAFELAKLHPTLDGTVIAQITDTHIGPTLQRAFVEEVVDKTNAISPDIIVLTGDIIDGSVKNLEPLLEPFRRFKAKFGVFFVTGNHEYYSGADEWIEHMRQLGIRVLRNERVEIGNASAQFDLAGIDDWTAHNFSEHHGANLKGALENRDPNRACVLLAHNPMAGTEAIEEKVDLMLSGHTHGGQIWPFNNMVRLVNRWVCGKYIEGNTQIYVSPGTGYWGPPMRLGTSAEIAKIVLHSPKGKQVV